MLNYLLKGFICALIMNIFQKNKLDMPVLVKMGFFSSLVLFMIDRMFPEGFKEKFDVEEDAEELEKLLDDKEEDKEAEKLEAFFRYNSSLEGFQNKTAAERGLVYGSIKK